MPGISCRWLRWRSGTGSCRTSFNVSCRFPRSRELRARPQLGRVGHGGVGPEPALGPVVRADARAERALLRPGFAHGGRDLEGKLASVGPISVFSLVRKRRQELVQEIAVRRMQLEHVEADAPGAERGADEILHQNFNFVDFKFTRNM